MRRREFIAGLGPGTVRRCIDRWRGFTFANCPHLAEIVPIRWRIPKRSRQD
jgi:hypothetical protein